MRARVGAITIYWPDSTGTMRRRTETVKRWSELAGFHSNTAYNRRRAGLSWQQIFTTPAKMGHQLADFRK